MDRADQLADFGRVASAWLQHLEPGEKARLLRRMAMALRRSQQQRHARQVGPDGATWAERKPRKTQKPASRAIRFLYRKGGGEVRLVDMRSWVRRGQYLTGFDREAEGLRTFRADRIATHLPAEGSADPGALPDSIRGPRGGVKSKARAMFRRLSQGRNLKAGASADDGWVEFTSRAARLARIHHYGLRDRVAPGGAEYDYPARELLGFSQDDQDGMMAILVEDMDRARASAG